MWGARVKNTDIFANNNHQIIVNKDHPVAKLIKQHSHEENVHVGRGKTLSSRRSKYWIPACRGIIGSLIIYCLYCKRKIITPIHYFTVWCLKKLCVNEKPFTNTGVDCLVPYHIHSFITEVHIIKKPVHQFAEKINGLVSIW